MITNYMVTDYKPFEHISFPRVRVFIFYKELDSSSFSGQYLLFLLLSVTNHPIWPLFTWVT